MYDEEHEYSYKKKYILETKKNDLSPKSRKGSPSSRFKKIKEKKFAEDSYSGFSPIRNYKYNDPIILIPNIKEDETKNKNGQFDLIHHIYLIVNNLFWYIFIYCYISENYSITNLSKHIIQVRLFYLWMSVLLIISLLYNKTLSNYNQYFKYVGVVFYILSQSLYYVGIIYFIIRISKDYSINVENNTIYDLAYCWLSYNYFILVLLLIIILSKLSEVFTKDDDEKHD